MSVIAIISAIAIPKFIQQQETAFVETSAIKLLAFLQLASSESIKQGKKLYVHYIPKTSVADGCIAFNAIATTGSDFCQSDNEYHKFKLSHTKALNVTLPSFNHQNSLFHFSASTGLPSRDLSLLLSAKAKGSNGSGIQIRRYKGLVGCSQTGILDWQPCS